MIEAPPPSVLIVPAPADARLVAPSEPSAIVQRDCQKGGATEIVVCGRRKDDRYRLGPQGPSALGLGDELKDAITFQVGPLEVGPQRVPGVLSTGNGMGVKIHF